MMKKWFSVILALMIVFSLTACTRVVVRVPAEVLQLFGSQSVGGYQAPAQQTPAQQTPATQTPAQQTPATQTPAAAKPAAADSLGSFASRDEAIAYYVTAYNKIATDSKSITRTYDYTSNYKNIVDVGGNDAIAKVAKTLMDANMKENFDEIPGTINDVAPKGLSSISINSSQVSQVIVEDKGDAYVITLKSTGTDENPELDCQPGQGSAGVIGPLLRTEDVAGGAGDMVAFEGLHAKYPQGQVTATIDKAGGHITELKFDCPCILHFDQAVAVKVLKVQNTELGLEFLQTWVMTY